MPGNDLEMWNQKWNTSHELFDVTMIYFVHGHFSKDSVN